MTLDEMVKLFNPVAIVVSGALNVYLFFKAKTDKRFQDIEDCQDTFAQQLEEDRDVVRMAIAERKAHISELAERFSVLDTRVRQLPTHKDLDTLNTRVAAIDERTRYVVDSVRRIENHLLDR